MLNKMALISGFRCFKYRELKGEEMKMGRKNEMNLTFIILIQSKGHLF